MTAPLPPDREQDIRTLLAAVTPGDWSAVELPPNEHHRHPVHWVETEYTDGDGTVLKVVAECLWQQADAAFIAGAPRMVRELLDEVGRLRDELAEEKAQRNPRLRCLIVKAAPDRDLYVGWSNICDMPAGAWTRAEALEYGFPPSRLDRADQTGTSSHIGDGDWDDQGFIAEQRGWLRRDRLGDYALLWLADKQSAAFDLLEPLDGETEVRR